MIGSVRLELRLPACRSLKEKRSVLRRFMERVRKTYNVAVAEIDAHDEWHTAVLEVAAVANERAHLHRVITQVVNEADRPGEMTLIDSEIEI